MICTFFVPGNQMMILAFVGLFFVGIAFLLPHFGCFFWPHFGFFFWLFASMSDFHVRRHFGYFLVVRFHERFSCTMFGCILDVFCLFASVSDFPARCSIRDFSIYVFFFMEIKCLLKCISMVSWVARIKCVETKTLAYTISHSNSSIASCSVGRVLGLV